MAKLITKHDPYHVHKVLGFLCLIHFVYRFARFVVSGDMGFESDNVWFVVGCMACHLMLSGSSLVFRLPKQRIKTDRPMIWPEFRAHNILFAYRPALAVIAHKVLRHAGLSEGIPVAGGVLIMGTLLGSDAISKYLFASKDKTMRGMPYPDGTPEESKKQIKRFHAIAQFHATMSTFVSMEFAFLSLMPVQLSAFLMTLVRKGMISSRDWHNYYAFTLVLPYVMLGSTLYSNVALLPYFFFTSIGARFRLQYNTNKFATWGCTLAAASAYWWVVRPDTFEAGALRYSAGRLALASHLIIFLYGALLVKDFTRLLRNLQSMPQDEGAAAATKADRQEPPALARKRSDLAGTHRLSAARKSTAS